MPDTASPGFVARHNQVVGSVLSIVALLAAVGMGAGLMFGTETRGVSAILTVLTVAGGTFTLLLLGIGATLRALTPSEQWEREEDDWRRGMGLPALADAPPPANHRRVALYAVLAVLVGLTLSVVPDIL
ncbi:hypothetical protein ACIRN4_12735 [Pimelobacter simplex]|uniref:Uncharacterized protein n=1 Tax=Nocardioides simplex TaxID=2045 RepID=A0A0A1DGD7_NOCSI|nr:hypothetical protein [Pimelobacter simplex]AIY16364.1 hypothetical protein KR76_05625 [Pimelobacter simplex]KAB2807221.1 hypothetical protein F9L07_27435 [Pimelobacter simplex]MCG8152975.1 hypothetical protein [Pimelobacter simplex]SFN03599.1 hypothetical protein SAMN05421671_4802 [Pimelobacter simplex]GEB11942.1 hypothetical protein NSI01_02570 [Pimelobacter simplex]